MARSMLRDSRLDRVIPGPNSGSYEVPELRGQSVRKLAFSCARKSNAAAKDENPTTLDGSLVVRPG
jgi:hypothetical protein